ncbi:hypothetical protein J3L16_00300 [Alteromonas sp. 5E99-2]|uniref:hypothetical protein n=1 Tax=Alteromonas sp. 5E99-2 TaxID=2817683 RepID=UPI001A99EA86|nr:hypothetical protein [Alteromonas sp. 5E99-2]MBO1254117.1 hypothetical protein [Alteromonas sp. 5E99-2]
MQNTQDLLRLCEQLSAKGLAPSVAMLRAKASDTLTLPQAIKVIQRYKSGERAQAVETKKDNTEPKPDTRNNLTPEERIEQLEEQNKQLNDRLLAIEHCLAGISRQQDPK